MKRVPWILLVIAATIVGALALLRDKPNRPNHETENVSTAEPRPDRGAFTPATTDMRLTLPKPSVVAIQDGKTIDFSSGLPIIKDTEKEKAALERALKQIEEASAGVSFGSPESSAKK